MSEEERIARLKKLGEELDAARAAATATAHAVKQVEKRVEGAIREADHLGTKTDTHNASRPKPRKKRAKHK